MSSLEATDNAAKAVQKTPNRASLDSLKGKIKSVEYIYPNTHPTMTIAVVRVENGFSVVGKTAPADPENFNEELGRQFAYEDAVRQLWPLEAYLMLETLSKHGGTQ